MTNDDNDASDNHTNDDIEEEEVVEDCNVFDYNKISGLLRCKNCNNAVFTIHKGNVVRAGTTSSIYTEIGTCCECMSVTIISDLREI